MYKFAEIEDTGKTDSATGNSIRISTTARMRFREIFPDFSNERNVRLNERIASVFNDSASKIMHYFPLGGVPRAAIDESTMFAEIRGGPGSIFFISALRGGNIDVLTIQNNWKIPTSGGGRKKLPKASLKNNELSDIKKLANIQAVWPQIYSMLKNPPQGINLGSFPSKLPSIDKFKIELSKNQTNPQAVGFVTTEDTNNDGTLDTIHISSERFMEELERSGIDRGEISALNNLPKEKLAGILSAFVEIIAHEMGHLKDYVSSSDNPFPGGESIAEQSGNQALQQISVATNKYKLNINRRYKMSSLKILADLANELDKLNEIKAADIVTDIMLKKSQQETYLGTPSEDIRVRDSRVEQTLSEGGVRPDAERPIQPTLPSSTPKDGAPISAKIQESGSATIGRLGEIRPVGDPFTYSYIPELKAFKVMSYTSRPGEEISNSIRRAIGAKFTEDSNKAAWDLLSSFIPPALTLSSEPSRQPDIEGVTYPLPLPQSEMPKSEAEDFTLASSDGIEDIQKKAFENVRRLESLFSIQSASGPFGRDK